jgi:SAM-dependent methyltransferase
VFCERGAPIKGAGAERRRQGTRRLQLTYSANVTRVGILDHFEAASAVLASVRDVVHERAVGREPPRWCEARGWTTLLRDMSDAVVLDAERDGLGALLAAMPDAPASLTALARDVARIVDLPVAASVAADAVSARRASPRKRQQVAAFAALVTQVSMGTSRVVDIGSGHGHLTRHLAAELGLEAEGWEHDAARVAVAKALTQDERARFVTTDVREGARDLRASDLVVGLHACGALGDLAAQATIAAGASLALVGCCLQKRDGDRRSLGDATNDSLTLGHAALGLGNVRDGDEGIEADLAARTASRVNRMALAALLLEAGQTMPHGGEMRGINRRRANGTLADLVTAAFAVRGLPVPSTEKQSRAAREAHAAYAYQRRWELPRTMLARAIEVWVALDRAALLVRAGYTCEVKVLFPARVSPRNIALLATPR